MHILLLFTIYASHFFTLLTCITLTFSRSDLQMRMLCMYHHCTLLIIAHYTAYSIDYPQALSYEKSTRATGITPRNHATNTAMFRDLLRSLSACFILICPPIFGHVSISLQRVFSLKALPSTELQPHFSAVTAFTRRTFYPLIRFFIRSAFALSKSHSFFLTQTHALRSKPPQRYPQYSPQR